MNTKIKNYMLAKLIALLVVFAGFISCNPEDLQNPDNPTGKSILQFSFKKDLNANLNGDVAATISGTSIAVSLPYGTAVTALKPSITFFAKSVSPAPEAAQDFTNPVKYTVTANDGSTQIYTVSVSLQASTEKAITALTFKQDLNPSLTADATATISGTNINVNLVYGTAVTTLKPSITFTGKSISAASEVVQDFTEPVTYTVTAEDGTTKTYTVTVTITNGGALVLEGQTIDINNLVPKCNNYFLSQGIYYLEFYNSNNRLVMEFDLNANLDGQWIDTSIPALSGWSPYVYISVTNTTYELYAGTSGGNGMLKITRTPNTNEFSVDFDGTTRDGKKIKGSYKGIFTNKTGV
jgi:hypothetical protein